MNWLVLGYVSVTTSPYLLTALSPYQEQTEMHGQRSVRRFILTIAVCVFRHDMTLSAIVRTLQCGCGCAGHPAGSFQRDLGPRIDHRHFMRLVDRLVNSILVRRLRMSFTAF
jgi:hypothetical protein